MFKKNFAFNDTMENMRFKISQYACAVLLIVSSIALVAYQVIMIDDVSNGLLVYVAQAFLLVASIFGLDYYVKLITRKINGKHQAQYTKKSHVAFHRMRFFIYQMESLFN